MHLPHYCVPHLTAWAGTGSRSPAIGPPGSCLRLRARLSWILQTHDWIPELRPKVSPRCYLQSHPIH